MIFKQFTTNEIKATGWLRNQLLKMNDYTTDAGTDARNYGELEQCQGIKLDRRK